MLSKTLISLFILSGCGNNITLKENKLENETNSKIISPDDKLKILLGLDDSQELTYFNIQKYMNKHFVKTIEA